MKLLVVSVAAFLLFLSAIESVPVTNSDPYKNWTNYKIKFNKTYNNVSGNCDEDSRRMNFIPVDQMIHANNENENSTFKMDHNLFSDFSPLEKKNRLGVDINLCVGCANIVSSKSKSGSNNGQLPSGVPQSFDLREKYPKCFPNVKDQGNCSSSWIFSAIAEIEFKGCKMNGDLVTLSEQQIIDCDTPNDGECNGGWPYEVFKYYETARDRDKILHAEKFYKPYTSGIDRKKGICIHPEYSQNLQIKLEFRIWNEERWEVHVFEKGAISVIMTVIESFYFYKSGVYSDADCKKDSLPNHAVVIVGYGTDNEIYHWIVRNSWGPNWGDGGYFKIRRGVNMCLIESYEPYYTTLREREE